MVGSGVRLKNDLKNLASAAACGEKRGEKQNEIMHPKDMINVKTAVAVKMAVACRTSGALGTGDDAVVMDSPSGSGMAKSTIGDRLLIQKIMYNLKLKEFTRAL